MDIQELSLPGQIGPYKILRKMASGGMGDIFLAEDPLCHRKLALKRIRADRRKQEGLRERFLKEAQIAAKLSHPCIIPIYQIHISEEEVYYTMPLVEGSTLKEILQTTREQEKEGGSHHPIGSSLLALMRIFLHIGQAMAYAHDKGVLHKDLKPENIIIGPYGEVLILDWGLAEQAGQEKEPLPMEEDKLGSFHLTRPGKVAGTLSYLPPERLYGHRASFASDIYALGVILYQMLTLRFPFQGKDVRQYKQRIKQGKLIDPLERAPYRDIPPQLAHIAKRCLAKHPNKRYPSVNNLLQDLNNYMEGKAEWVPCGGVQVESKEDWLLQENILLSKHISLTREADILEWAHLMVAKRLFSENIKIETHVRIHKTGKGIGFLLHIHPPTGGKGEDFFREGFFLWIGSARSPGIYLFRSNMELLSNPSFFLEENISYFVSVQKIGSHIQLSINGTLVLDYIGHIPLYGPHIGLVLKDESLDVGTLLLSSSSPNIQVHCLTVPDTLLALHHFQEAKEKYREIANSFEGRVEGKEAIYKGGLALLEEAKAQKNRIKQQQLLEEALLEFSKLHEGGGSPLEFLGKSFVYKAIQEPVEEWKCLELALRRFPKHPTTPLIQEHVLLRFHESCYKERLAAYELALLSLQLIPHAWGHPYHQKNLEHIQTICEPLPFLEGKDATSFCLQLAFWLNKPWHLIEIAKKSSPSHQKQALYALLYLDKPSLAKELLPSCPAMDILFQDPVEGLQASQKSSLVSSQEKDQIALFFLSSLPILPLSKQKALLTLARALDSNHPLILDKKIECLLYEQRLDLMTTTPSSRFLQGCLEACRGGVQAAEQFFFAPCEEIFPPSAHFLDHFFSSSPSQRKQWEQKAFFFEKKLLFTQLFLLYRCARCPSKERAMRTRLQHLTMQS